MNPVARPHRLLLIFGLAMSAVLFAVAAPVGAADDTIELPFRPWAMEHDDATDLFLIATDPSEYVGCGGRDLHFFDHDGVAQWQVPAPAACFWLLEDGVLYVATEDVIRAFDVATASLTNTWTVPDGQQAREMFLGGGNLWFNYGRINQLSAGVGIVTPGFDDEPSMKFFDRSHVVAVSPDSQFFWLLDERGLTMFDQDGPTDEFVAPRNDLFRPGLGYRFHVSADQRYLYGLGTEYYVLDALTLEVVAQASPSGIPHRLFELDNGNIATAGVLANQPVEIFAPGSAQSLGTGPSINASGVSDVALAGRQLAVAQIEYTDPQTIYRIEFHDVVPSLIETPTQAIDANNPRTVFLNVHWADAVETITIDGQAIRFTPIMDAGRISRLSVELPALPAGQHLVVFDGPLGQSLDVPANELTITAELPRAQIEVLIRPDSANGEVETWTVCSESEDGETDISIKQLVRAGSRLVFEPVVGHTCSVQFSRQDSGGTFNNDWSHVTTGFFDPDSDPNAWTMFDTAEWYRQFTVKPGSVGVAAFLPAFDETIVWAYSYGFGSPSSSDRNPVALRCGDGTKQYDTYLGYWSRVVIDRDEPCTIEHSPSPSTEFGGFALADITGGTRPPFREGSSMTLDAGESGYVVIVYDIYSHPSEHNGAFARQQYLDFLGREGDSGGLRFWEDALNSGSRQRTDLIQLFLDSPEFGGTVAPVSRLYQAYFDRAPDREGLFFWVNWIRDGRSLGQVSDEFARSPEFINTYGSLSDEDFIDLVYTNVLDRLPDSAGRAFWVDQMRDGLSRGQLMANFSESPEFIDQTSAAVLVESLYQGLLQRSPDAEGFAFWVGVAESGEPVTNLIAGMLSSDEYYFRFDNIVDELPSGNASQTTGGEQRLVAGPLPFND